MPVKKSDAASHLSEEETAQLSEIETYIDAVLRRKFRKGSSVEIMFKDLKNGFDGPELSEKIIEKIIADYKDAEWKVSRETSHDGQYFTFS